MVVHKELESNSIENMGKLLDEDRKPDGAMEMCIYMLQ